MREIGSEMFDHTRSRFTFLPDSTDNQDAGSPEDNVRIVKETVGKLGGLDIIVANAGWTRFSNFADLNALSLEEWNKVRG